MAQIRRICLRAAWMNTSSEQIRQEPRMSLPMQSAPLWRLRIQRALFRRNTRMNRSGGCGFRGMLTMDIKNGDRRDVFCYSSDMPRLVRNDSKFRRTGNVPSVPDFQRHRRPSMRPFLRNRIFLPPMQCRPHKCCKPICNEHAAGGPRFFEAAGDGAER